MSNDEKDLFGGSLSDGDDTDDLLATAYKNKKTIARKKRSTINKTSNLGTKRTSAGADDSDSDDSQIRNRTNQDEESTCNSRASLSSPNSKPITTNDEGAQNKDNIVIPTKIQPGQEHFLLKIVSHMFRQQADMSMAHAAQLEQMSMEYKQKNNNITSQSVDIGSVQNGGIINIRSSYNSNSELLEEQKYREDMLHLAKNSLEGITKIHQILDQLFPLIQCKGTLDHHDEFIYDAFGLPVSKIRDINDDRIDLVDDKKRGSMKRRASDLDSPSASKSKLRSGAVLGSDSSYSSYSQE